MKTPEGKVKDTIRKYLDTVPDAYHFPIVQGGYGKRGTVDRVICWRGLFIGVEAKRVSSLPLSPSQKLAMDKILRAGGVHLKLGADNWEELKKYVY